MDGMTFGVNDIEAALREIRGAYGSSQELNKAVGTFVQPGSATAGLQHYNLEPAAKNLYPVMSPFRNRIARRKATGGTQANWKAVTAIDSGNISIGVGEGNRGGGIQVTTADYFAMFRTIGLEASVTVEAELSAEGFDDLKSRAVRTNLQVLMQKEERMIVGGNTSVALGQTLKPTLVAATSGGSLLDTTLYSVVCVALTNEGLQQYSTAIGPQWMVTRANTDGSSDTFGGGAAQPSQNTTVTTGSSSNVNKITASLANGMVGAVAYAWYVGTTVGAERLWGVTASCYAVITAAPSGSAPTIPAAALTTDASQNGLGFDGFISLCAKTTNAQWKALTPGASLTSDGQGGIVEFDAILQWYWDSLRMAPSRIVLQSTELMYIRKAILNNTAAGVGSRLTFFVDQKGLTGGSLPKGYLNMFAQGNGPAEIPFELHPYMPPGTILFLPDELPYEMNNVPELQRILCRRDYYQYDWPQRSRKTEYGLYSDQVFQHYFPISIAVISNIAPGVTLS